MSVEHPNNGRAAGRIIDTADLELFEYIEKSLYTAVLSDALDEMGLQEQAMRETIRPLSPGYVLAGWARTISSMDVWTSITPSRIPTTSKLKPWTAWLPGEIAVVATGDSKRNAPWGELLSTAALSRGARGAVIDCLVRDVKKIQALGFPVFAAGIKPVDSPGRGVVVDYNVSVGCGGVVVAPADLVVADFDGVIVVPAAAVTEAVRLATEKVARENHSRAG